MSKEFNKWEIRAKKNTEIIEQQQNKEMSKTTKKRKPRKQPKKGFGDIVEEVLEKTGAAKVAKFILGEDCGCTERKNKLNELFRTTKKPDCLLEDEYKWLKEWFAKASTTYRPSERDQMIKIYSRIFRVKTNATNCASCLREIHNKMKTVFETYE